MIEAVCIIVGVFVGYSFVWDLTVQLIIKSRAE